MTRRYLSKILKIVLLAAAAGCLARAAAAGQDTASAEHASVTLGPDDQIAVRALGIEEIDGKPARIDPQGNIDVPLVGRIKAAGLTIEQLEAAIAEQLHKYVRDPRVTVTITEYKSETASVLGEVNTPGVYSLTDATTLLQVLSKAGGLRSDAGNRVEITRRREAGAIPLETARADASGSFSTAEVNLRSLLEAKSPEHNITIKSGDVISVPRADLVYIVGAVRKPGGFVLNERESMTALQAVSMAEGVEKTSAPQRAKIIRSGSTTERQEIPVDLSKILSGQSEDVPLIANDILVVPTSGAKAAFYRSMEALVQAGVGVAIYH
jgi:polysaccharide export outer membrane protein